MIRRVLISFIAGFATLTAAAGTVRAVEMTPGGYGDDPAEFFVPPSAGLRSELTLDSLYSSWKKSQFTPRSSGLRFRPSTLEKDGLNVGLSYDFGWVERLQGSMGPTGTVGIDDSESMIVGGGLEFDDFGIMGGLGRTQLFGTTTDMVAAGLSYGWVRARVAFGQSETQSTTSSVRDVMMFSTDLAAWSWLTLEGDVAIGESADEGDQAIGRLGVRLEF